MPEPAAFKVRLEQALGRIDAEPPGGQEADALSSLRRSVELTLRRLAGGEPSTAPFRFQISGGRGILFQGSLALPLEPARLSRLLGSMDLALQSSESIDVDGALAGWVIRPELALTDTQLRHAEDSLRSMKTGRDRDHAAFQAADSLKVRLRSRLTMLVSALQIAQSPRPA
jgi:hypothetical protein